MDKRDWMNEAEWNFIAATTGHVSSSSSTSQSPSFRSSLHQSLSPLGNRVWPGINATHATPKWARAKAKERESLQPVPKNLQTKLPSCLSGNAHAQTEWRAGRYKASFFSANVHVCGERGMLEAGEGGRREREQGMCIPVATQGHTQPFHNLGCPWGIIIGTHGEPVRWVGRKP